MMKTISQLREGNLCKASSIEIAPFVFLDTETTGLYPNRGARITEIAVIDRSGVVFQFEANSQEETGLNAPLLEDLFLKLRGSVIVAHNCVFDLRFLFNEALRLGAKPQPALFADTLSLSKELIPGLYSYKLSALLNHFGIIVKAPLHTALTDAYAVRSLFWNLVELGKFETLKDLKVQKISWGGF